jgi:hypothetical protein
VDERPVNTTAGPPVYYSGHNMHKMIETPNYGFKSFMGLRSTSLKLK